MDGIGTRNIRKCFRCVQISTRQTGRDDYQTRIILKQLAGSRLQNRIRHTHFLLLDIITGRGTFLNTAFVRIAHLPSLPHQGSLLRTSFAHLLCAPSIPDCGTLFHFSINLSQIANTKSCIIRKTMSNEGRINLTRIYFNNG